VLIDFDDTAAEQNVAELLLKRFGNATWQEVRLRFRAGEINLKEYQEITFRNIQADQATLQDYVKAHANLRPYFRDLWDYCLAHGIPMAIVSQGLDFYIRALLDGEGFPQIPVYSVVTRFTPQGITYQYDYTRPGQESRGNSKGLVVDRYRQRGHYVFYVGDGISDFEAAGRTDLLFAHRTLADECVRQGIPFQPFTDFSVVLQALEEYVGNGHRPGHSKSARCGETCGPSSPGELKP
jgi:2,3-diketo-5-methylthio-1-phosphopentane phosphatase